MKRFKMYLDAVFRYSNWLEIVFSRFYAKLMNKEGSFTLCKLNNGLRIKMRALGCDFGIAHDIFLGTYTKFFNTLPLGTVIDIGASIGTFSLFAVKMGAKKVYSFEPEKENFFLLKENIRLNRYNSRIKPFRMAVDKTSGTADLNVAGNRVSHSLFSGWSENFGITGTQKVRTISLEDIFKTNKIKHCDFLKMDCEGAEFGIFLSTPKRIFGKINRIVLEYHKSGNRTELDILKVLKKNRFSSRIERRNGAEGMIYALNMKKVARR